MILNYAINSTDGVELVDIIQPDTSFSGKLFINNKNQVLREAKKDHVGLII